MKCKKCAQRASIQMRQHHLALCKDHFLDWFVEQTQRFIRKYQMMQPQQRLLLAVSGGKDSLTAWDVLHRLGYAVDGLYIHLGIEGEDHYSDQSEALCRQFAQQRGLHLQVVRVQDECGLAVPELARSTHRGHHRPCAVCGLVKRHLFNQAATAGGYEVLVTGHNLDDEAAVLFGNTLIWSTDLLRRQSPVLEETPGFPRKVKPLCRFYERETAAYAILRGIEYIEQECLHVEGSTLLEHKAVLNQMEAGRPGMKQQFYLKFLQARQGGLLAPAPIQAADPSRCPRCGQPTTANGLCTYCRLMDKSRPWDGLDNNANSGV